MMDLSVRRAGLPLTKPLRTGGELILFHKLNSKHVRLKPEPLPPKLRDLLAEQQAADLTLPHSAFALVPAGSYTLVGYQSAKYRWRGTAHDDASGAPAFGTFQVQPGEVVYLGSLEMWLNEPGDIPGLMRSAPRFAVFDHRERARLSLRLLNRSLSNALQTRLMWLSPRAIKSERLSAR